MIDLGPIADPRMVGVWAAVGAYLGQRVSIRRLRGIAEQVVEPVRRAVGQLRDHVYRLENTKP